MAGSLDLKDIAVSARRQGQGLHSSPGHLLSATEAFFWSVPYSILSETESRSSSQKGVLKITSPGRWPARWKGSQCCRDFLRMLGWSIEAGRSPYDWRKAEKACLHRRWMTDWLHKTIKEQQERVTTETGAAGRVRSAAIDDLLQVGR